MSDTLCIQSLIDTDFYKLTMQQAYLHQLPNAEGVWEFYCRSHEDLTPYIFQIREQLEALADLQATESQLAFLHSRAPYLKDDYLAFLRLFRFNLDQLDVRIEKGRLIIRVKGPQLHVSLFEIPVMATVSEIRNKMLYPGLSETQIRNSTQHKIEQLNRLGDSVDLDDFRFFDFGTRRRFSYQAQHIVAEMLQQAVPKQFGGTSNPHLAQALQLPFLGTMAHEWLQTHQGLNYRLVDSQKAALENWVREYRGDLGVALTDVIGVDAFCRDLDRYFAKLYDGFRHDSGDPILWGEKIIARLEALRVDPTRKMLVFSDGLDFSRAVLIYKHFKGRIQTSFGIGTWLMADFEVNKPLNAVMKMVSLGGQPVAKISDSPGKTMCHDRAFLTYLMDVFAVDAGVREHVLLNAGQGV
ncbi:nicotinate phosphoribosyltransferase [Tolumonas lignilytica]|uniref:nicotinate phosphoribosyltransferase n=1 Tax=Tolumonas lignilytica TaxID=1283284 RepID=UPI000464EEBB|nr:nicotinate phosphoribosyltransferase [Tolumonas lignilytica]